MRALLLSMNDGHLPRGPGSRCMAQLAVQSTMVCAVICYDLGALKSARLLPGQHTVVACRRGGGQPRKMLAQLLG